MFDDSLSTPQSALRANGQPEARPRTPAVGAVLELGDDAPLPGRLHAPCAVVVRHVPAAQRDGPHVVRVVGPDALRRRVVTAFLNLGLEVREPSDRSGSSSHSTDLYIDGTGAPTAAGRITCDGGMDLLDHVQVPWSIESAQEIRAGRDVRVDGDLAAEGDVDIGQGSCVDGAVRCRGALRLGTRASIQGSVESQGLVLGSRAAVAGRIRSITPSVRPLSRWTPFPASRTKPEPAPVPSAIRRQAAEPDVATLMAWLDQAAHPDSPPEEPTQPLPFQPLFRHQPARPRPRSLAARVRQTKASMYTVAFEVPADERAALAVRLQALPDTGGPRVIEVRRMEDGAPTRVEARVPRPGGDVHVVVVPWPESSKGVLDRVLDGLPAGRSVFLEQFDGELRLTAGADGPEELDRLLSGFGGPDAAREIERLRIRVLPQETIQ